MIAFVLLKGPFTARHLLRRFSSVFVLAVSNACPGRETGVDAISTDVNEFVLRGALARSLVPGAGHQAEGNGCDQLLGDDNS
jgi:hypothetical protein